MQAEDVPASAAATTAIDAAAKAIDFYRQIQTEDGHWAMDYGGPMFLMPGTFAIVDKLLGIDSSGR